MEAISYKLPVFEGPLDLLLQLVQKNKLNIYDIPIVDLVRQYLEVIRQMQEQDLEIASEFLDMAARLVYLKSTMLLPKHEETEELKQALVSELISYQLCQEAARRLGMRQIGGDLFVREPEEIDPDMTYRLHHPRGVLLDSYLAAVGRGRRRLPPSPQAFRGIVARKIVSVGSRITYVLRRLYRQKQVAYGALFEQAESKSELVATFLALLELIKVKRVQIDGDGEQAQVRMLGAYPEEEVQTLVEGLTSENGN